MARKRRSDFSKPVLVAGRTARFSEAQMIAAIEQAQGIVAGAARILHCHRDTVQNYIDRYPSVKAAFDAAWETNLDGSEHVILTALRSKDFTVSVPVAKWLLVTRGKDRGYVEKVDVHVVIGQERQRVRSEAEAKGLDADLAVAEFERMLAETKR
jgi:hypothetical protein